MTNVDSLLKINTKKNKKADILKANFSKKPAKKIFSPMARKMNLNFDH